MSCWRRAPRGFTLLELLLVIFIIAVIATIAIPNLIAARRHSGETTPIGALKTIATAESIFREGDKEGDGRTDYGTLSELSQAQLIDSVLGSGTKQGYLFQAGYSTITSEFLWFATATPCVPGETGDRYFCTNQTAVIFYTTAAPFPMNTTDCEIPGHAYPIGK